MALPVELERKSKVDPDGHYAGMLPQRSLNRFINTLKIIMNERALLPNEGHSIVIVAIVNPEVRIGRVSMEIRSVVHECFLVGQLPDTGIPR